MRRPNSNKTPQLWLLAIALSIPLSMCLLGQRGRGADAPAPQPVPAAADIYGSDIRPLVQKYCLNCHSTKAKKGSLDLERFATIAHVRKDIKPWQQTIELLEAGEMPPAEKPQPTPAERKQLIDRIRALLDAEARARVGDPGFVPLRRLSNAEYDATIRDLTGVDLKPTREFPADGAAGEGFTNAAEALTDISPTLLGKYLNAAKAIAEHMVLLPDGLTFSPGKTRRDWTDESTAELRRFYARHAPADGKLPLAPYLAATVRHRDALLAGTTTPAEVAAKEKLNAKYLTILWQTLTDKAPSQPLDDIRARWRSASEKDVPALTAEVAAWQASLWHIAKVGNYVRPARPDDATNWGANAKGFVESLTRQVPLNPPALASVPLRMAVKPTPGQTEVTLYLATRELVPAGGGSVVWGRPRLEAAGKPALLLRDYAEWGSAFELDLPSAYGDAGKYLSAVADLALDKSATVEALAKSRGLDAEFLKRWVAVLALSQAKANDEPATPLTLLEEKTAPNEKHPWVKGWRKKGTDLPVLVTNSSDRTEHVPGRVVAHGVSVHPLPKEFVAVAWKSPIAGEVRVEVRVAHAHPACGNGVAWRLEHRRAGRASPLGEGSVDLGKEAKPPTSSLKVDKGDVLLLAVDARAGNHICDLTEIAFTVAEVDKPARTWDLAADIADTVHAGNPHADKHGHADTWSFVRGPSRGGTSDGAAPIIPLDSTLGRWRAVALDPLRAGEAAALADRVAALLSGPRPAGDKSPDRALYDRLTAFDSPLFTGVDVAKLAKPRATAGHGLPKDRFGSRAGAGAVDTADLVSDANSVVEIRLPVAALATREFVVDARLDNPGDRVARFRVQTAANIVWDSAGPVAARADGDGYKRLVAGFADMRRVFPLFVCFPNVVPNDEVVTLKMFHREDEPLVRLFLDPESTSRLDHLWTRHRFISRQAAAEFDYLPQFMAFTTQDTPKPFQQFFIDRKPTFRKDAEAFEAEEAAAIPAQMAALLDFAERAYRRPLSASERTGLTGLHQAIRAGGADHAQATRDVISRVLISPAFLFRIEQPPAGPTAGAVNQWELATRLSYFLWSSMPDDELRRLAAEGKLTDPTVLAQQTQRMLRDARVRNLAIEFGTQWLHVRGFDAFNEKNEKLFPTFDAALRSAVYEESILFFVDLFGNDRAVTSVLDADHTFLNETLAKHYGIPGVTGPQWRRVEGVRKFGRGGILGLASVQAKQSGASRTSPVLRGNWVVETLLGEKLPRPPANVPQLPEVEGADKLTTRQLVENHAKVPACATCHVRIDPFGFALERYDAIGRRRDRDLGGSLVDTRAKLRDGTEFDGLDGLRSYLLDKKKDVIVRLLCRKLLGYALGRSTALSDQSLIDELVAELNRNEGRISAAVATIVRSPQFRKVRGAAFEE